MLQISLHEMSDQSVSFPAKLLGEGAKGGDASCYVAAYDFTNDYSME